MTLFDPSLSFSQLNAFELGRNVNFPDRIYYLGFRNAIPTTHVVYGKPTCGKCTGNRSSYLQVLELLSFFPSSPFPLLFYHHHSLGICFVHRVSIPLSSSFSSTSKDPSGTRCTREHRKWIPGSVTTVDCDSHQPTPKPWVLTCSSPN